MPVTLMGHTIKAICAIIYSENYYGGIYDA